MVFFAVPDAAPQPVYQTDSVVAVAPSSSTPAAVKKMTYGVCKLFYAYDEDRQGPPDMSVNTLSAADFMTDFLSKDLQKVLRAAPAAGGPEWDWYDQWLPTLTTTLLRAPQHGKFVNVQNDPNNEYLADRGYIGKDRIDMLVEGKDDLGRPISLTVRYYINVLSDKEKAKLRDEKTADKTYRKYCGTSKIYWRISNSEAASRLVIGEAGNLRDLTGLYSQAAANLKFAELPNGALGQTTGTTITLDDNAAGWGWFIDATPGTNEEFLPTADPNVWKAKPGSEAEGKMDLLSVLLHEYGHTLGLEHSADAHNTMAATLQPGERRTLSADDQLALMQLTGYFPTSSSPGDPFSPFLGTPLLFGLGRLRGTVTDLFTTSDNAGEANTRARLPHYEVVANPTLTNPEFAGSTGWSTTGTVSLGNGAAVLTESAAAHMESKGPGSNCFSNRTEGGSQDSRLAAGETR